MAQVAASVSYGLIKNHAFVDGNKRIGFAALDIFLEVNGYSLAVSEAEVVEMVLKLASSEISEEDWVAWVERSVALKS